MAKERSKTQYAVMVGWANDVRELGYPEVIYWAFHQAAHWYDAALCDGRGSKFYGRAARARKKAMKLYKQFKDSLAAAKVTTLAA